MAEERGQAMSTLVGLQQSPGAWEQPLSKPLDEVVWQAWLEKGRMQDRRSSAALGRAVKWVPIAGLIAAAGLWPHLTPYEIVLRFGVATCATIVMLQAFNAKRHAVAVVFAAIALLYNPVAPVFSFSGDWQRALVVASTVPFIASLVWPNVWVAHNE